MEESCSKNFCCLVFILFLNFLLLLKVYSDQPYSLILHYNSDIAYLSYDSNHIPHINGTSDEAVYFALGYAQAADRLWQMDIFRRISGGKMSAVIFSNKCRY